jgi:hypothetical protein
MLALSPGGVNQAIRVTDSPERITATGLLANF